MPEQEPFPLTIDQIRRYQRQIIMPEIGGEGQRKLLQARVLLVGAGDLGSPAALYLASAGIGTLGIIDDGILSPSDLSGQILYGHKNIGKPKVDLAKNTLRDRNPDTQVITYRERLTPGNALEIFQEYDVIINCSNNSQSSYLLNDASYLLKKPFIDAAVLYFGGRVATYVPGEGCYRCEYPTPLQSDDAPTGFEVIAIGAVSGFIGGIQANEAIKLIVGKGESLKGRTVILEGLGGEYNVVERKQDQNCELCGDNPTIRGLSNDG